VINLLPPEIKESYHYARRNRSLLRWVSVIVTSLAVAAALIGGGYLYLNQQINTNQKIIDTTTHQLQKQNLTSVQRQVTEISSNLKLAVQVLSKEILFSELLKRLASVTPSNTILTNLAITQTQGGVDVTAQTANYDAATQLQINLADPKNQIFSKADIVSISCTSGGAGGNALAAQYPCTATLRALFATNNPFLFINSGAKK
jgi:Tfp pilus assembly protein PilN